MTDILAKLTDLAGALDKLHDRASDAHIADAEAIVAELIAAVKADEPEELSAPPTPPEGMNVYRVRRNRDAYVNYVAWVFGKHPEDAQRRARKDQVEGGWIEDGTSEFDARADNIYAAEDEDMYEPLLEGELH